MIVRIAGLAALGLSLALAPGHLRADGEENHKMQVQFNNYTGLDVILRSDGVNVDNSDLNKGKFGPTTISAGSKNRPTERNIDWEIEHCPPDKKDSHIGDDDEAYKITVLYTNKASNVENVTLCTIKYKYNHKNRTCHLLVDSLLGVDHYLSDDDPNNVFTPDAGYPLNDHQCVDKSSSIGPHIRILNFIRTE